MTNYDSNLRAKVVKLWNTPVRIPEELGVPRADQMQGTPNEQVCELAGRACYDSMGAKNSRNSGDYHQHIGQVKHFSTIEHAVFTVEIKNPSCSNDYGLLLTLWNRPQLQVHPTPSRDTLRVTLNLRHVVEWDKQSSLSDCIDSDVMRQCAAILGQGIASVIAPLAPMIVKAPERVESPLQISVVEPITESERFVSVFLGGGRGFSHEMVRHRFAISQRSSRFCDEGDSPIIEHPLLSEYLADNTVGIGSRAALRDCREEIHAKQRILYKDGVDRLQAWLKGRGLDATSARKQARGAMRNDLGNGLYTEMIFTASIAMWKHMFSMRSSSAADAEIREVFCRLLPTLQAEGLFQAWKMVPAPDGLGHCVVM